MEIIGFASRLVIFVVIFVAVLMGVWIGRRYSK